jgi:guanylate kinase
VVFGPGGAGKGTVVDELLRRVPGLWLSRSWTTRARRQGEPEDAYRFVDQAAFRAHADAGGFLEWVEFLPGQLYGTPVPETPPGHDLVLEIDVRGAGQVRERFPDALLVLLLPPSRDAQAARLRARGDAPERVAERLALADREEPEGRRLADHVVVNDDLDRAVRELAAIVEHHRAGTAPPATPSLSGEA